MKISRAWRGAACLLALGLGMGACKKKEAEQDGSAAGSGSGAVVATGSAAEAELAPAPATAGLTWKRIDMPFGSLELPADPGWNLVGTDVQGPDDLVLVLQAQEGVTPDQQATYLKQYGKLQARDARGYRAKAHMGTLRGDPAIRIEGTFDNGTKYVTREYLVFAKDKVIALSAHIPAVNADKLPGIIDQVARTLQVK